MKIAFLLLYGVLAVLALASLLVSRRGWKRGLRSGRATTDRGSTGPDIGERVLRRHSLSWQEILPHVKLGEFLQISGEAISGDEYLVILQAEVNRKLDFIYARYAKTRQNIAAGDKSLLTVSQNSSLRVFASGAKEIGFEMIQQASEAPDGLLGDASFDLVISNVASLKTGNSIHVAAKCSTLQFTFIKPWEVPSRQADEALVANNALSSDLAHLAERIQDVQRAAILGSLNGAELNELKPGICYVLGNWGGDRMAFLVERDVALLVVESFDSSMSLAGFLASLSLKPVMHTRLVCAPPCIGASAEPILICPAAKAESHRIIRLASSNAILSIHHAEGEAVDVLRVAGRSSPGGGAGPQVILTYLPSKRFQNVLVWCLPPGRSSLGLEERSGPIRDPVVSRNPASGTEARASNFCLALPNSRIGLNQGTSILGRAPDVDVVVDDQFVSTRHCELRVEGNTVLIRDLGSSNGTYVEGTPIGNSFVEAQGRVRIGSVEFSLQTNSLTLG